MISPPSLASKEDENSTVGTLAAIIAIKRSADTHNPINTENQFDKQYSGRHKENGQNGRF